MKRFGQMIRVKPEKFEEYRRLHAAVWPEVLKMITACNIRNYSIYLRRMPDGLLWIDAEQVAGHQVDLPDDGMAVQHHQPARRHAEELLKFTNLLLWRTHSCAVVAPWTQR